MAILIVRNVNKKLKKKKFYGAFKHETDIKSALCKWFGEIVISYFAKGVEK